MRVTNGKAPGFEADDFLAAAVAAEERRGGTALVATGDRDAFQLASETTTILYPLRAGDMARIGPNEVRERYGVASNQVPDFILAHSRRLERTKSASAQQEGLVVGFQRRITCKRVGRRPQTD
jgi:DNA polymerase-1